MTTNGDGHVPKVAFAAAASELEVEEEGEDGNVFRGSSEVP